MGFWDFFKRKTDKTKKINKNIKLGLALGGGGARGFAHLGVLKAFDENGIKFDYIAGTSVGSLVGAFYASGLTGEEIIEISKKINKKDIKNNKIMFMPSSTEGIQTIIKKNLGDIDIKELKTPFCAVAVDMKSGNEVNIKSGSLAKAVAGSCAVPGVFSYVDFGDFRLQDGGLQNTIPSDVVKSMGADFVVAVDCNPSRGYGTDSPKLMDILSATIRILMKSNAVKGKFYADVIIEPDTKRFKSTKLNGAEEMIEEGYKAGLEKVAEIKELLTRKVKTKKQK
ncbi:MAG: patatin-like phospholipase family protein [Christensenellales bacterium]